MSLSGISFGGLSSGIDTTSIISRLIQIEGLPIQRLRQQQQDLQSRQSVYSQLRSQLSSLSQAGSALNVVGAFNPVSATAADTSVATLSGSSGATAGNYALSISQLAQTQKISSAAKADTTTALGLTAGTIVVNGNAVSIDESDTLKTIAQKINSNDSGITASLIDGGTGSAYLTLTAGNSGAKNKIQISDASGTVLQQLGLTGSSPTVRESVTNGATSVAFSSSSDSVQSLLGSTGLGPSTFSLNGTSISVDLSTDSLQQIADKINSSASGAKATVRTEKDSDDKTTYQIDITGTSSTPTFDDPNKVLQALGVLQADYTNQLVVAQDAKYKLDNVELTSSTNTITSVIPGATLTLNKYKDADTPTEPATTTLRMTRDSNAIKTKLKNFADAYNGVLGFIKGNSDFKSDTYESGPLFGDAVAQQVENTLSSMIFTDVPGLTGTYKNLSDIGFKFNSDGSLTADDSKLNAAIAKDPEAVGDLFRSTGEAAIDTLQYVSSTTDTKTSGTVGYNVNITQVATKGKVSASVAQTSANPIAEKLTFGGNLLGSTNYVLNLDVGATLQSTVNKINSDSKLKELLSAKIDGGKLVFESRRFGTGGNFTVYSNYAAGSDNSGIGYGGGVVSDGVNIAGTINGAAATGSGQYLSGDKDTGDAAGLQIQYTGTTIGDIGNVKFRKGIGTQTSDRVATFTDSVNGLLSSADTSIQDQIDSIKDSIDDLSKRLVSRQDELKQKFAKMEEAISNIQSQGQRLSSLGKTS